MTREFAEQEMERRALALGTSHYVYHRPPFDEDSYIVTSRELDGHEPVATYEQ